MKKLLLLLLCGTPLFAQETGSPIAEKKNEVRLDVLSAVAYGKANLSYERFLSDDWSVGLTGSFSFSDKFDKDFDRGYRNTLPKTEIIPYVRYRLSDSFKSYYFVEVFASLNSGDYKEMIRDSNGATAIYRINKEGYFDVAPGASIGYKVYFAEKFVLEFLAGAGFNLLDPDKSPDVVTRLGINVGYRF
ncbi:DUF3575 domain-containing protein [Flavobacterium silvaticum]|uniref:DUF3575 domain-containing protein n=1 Tax=Flavobacterium silvaticum TaxID=1852020 RepID=A0A972FUZ2_9FLAO|nr:DUF3575 domain-containing protein [Flavobacterium silvaticum]NMH29018.1 DUF3575 domain-containing protein [Flavobacterium silvaticum]